MVVKVSGISLVINKFVANQAQFTIASRLGFVLSGPYKNAKVVSNTSVKFVNSHLMKSESLVHESIEVKQDLSTIFQQKRINDFSLSQKDT